MGLSDIAQQAKGMTSYRLDQKLDEFFRKNPSFKYLADNQGLVFDLIKKYKEKSRKGIAISALSVREDMYHLYQNRLELKLTKRDLDQLRDLLEDFKA
jgi:hypothetical protein